MGLFLRADQMLCFVPLSLLPVGTETLRWETSTVSSRVKKITKKAFFLNIFTLCQQK